MDQRTKRLEAYFTEKCLTHTCFDSLKDLQTDRTLVQVNAPRAMIAVNLIGGWRGLQLGYSLAVADLEDS